MMRDISVTDFEGWRAAARGLILSDTRPEDVSWNAPNQAGLFETETAVVMPQTQGKDSIHVPKAFVTLAQNVAYHRDDNKWGILYRTLWRLQHEHKQLLHISTDDDVMALHRMAKQVSRDAHKMKAFVRFREIKSEANSFVAWHEPSHLVVKRTAPFFARRFSTMLWSILTPDECVHWNGKTLSYSAGVSRSEAPTGDEMEELWKTFYRNIFNPARIKINMMKSEMPVKYWHTMPETALIPEMLESADKRVQAMIEASGEREEP